MVHRSPADTFANALSRVRLRVRVARMVALAPTTLGVTASVLGALALVRWVAHDPRFVEPYGCLAVVAGLALVAPLARRVPLAMAARLADVTHGLDSRLENATCLIRAESLGPFERAAVDDAIRHLPIDPRRAVPIVVSRRAPLAVLGLAGALALGTVPLPSAPAPRATRPRLSSVELDAETIAATRAELAPIRRNPTSPDVERTLHELDGLLDDLASGAIDRDEAFRRLDAIGRAVASRGSAGPSPVEQALRTLGRALGARSTELAELAEALRNADARAASAAMRTLSARMARGEIDRAEIERIRQAFARMDEERRGRESHAQELERRRDALRSSLERGAEDATNEPSLLERRQRELERLERELGELAEQRRELERLERELDEAAEDLDRHDPSSASQDLDEAFEDLNRMARERSSAEQRRQLARQIEQLREAMRRQSSEAPGSEGASSGAGGGSSPMRRFVLRAGGEGMRIVGPGGTGAEENQGADQPRQGEGDPSSGEQPGGGDGDGDGSGPRAGQAGGEGAGQTPGSGAGQAEGPNGETVLRLTQDGRGADGTLELPGHGPGPSRGQGGRGGSVREGSELAGAEHMPATLDAPTDLDSQGEVSRVDGEAGRGATRSQVIRGASSSGFAGRSYRDVHADYANHAEEILEREDVPPGYRYYVRRYFQLIRPREGSTP